MRRISSMNLFARYNRSAIVLSLISTAINTGIASNFAENKECKITLIIISICIFSAAPCHYLPPPFNRYKTRDVISCICASFLISIILLVINPIIFFILVILETFISFFAIKFQLFDRCSRYLENLQKKVLCRKIPNSTGYAYYPAGDYITLLYYYIVYKTFGIVLYNNIESIAVLFIFLISSIICFLPAIRYAFTIIIFNKKIIIRKFIFCNQEFLIESIRNVECKNMKFKMLDANNKNVLSVSCKMTGDVIQLLTLCQKRKRRSCSK